MHVGLEYINSDITPLEQKRVGLQLQQEAKDAGGAVHTLLGNHELMNLNSQFAYVSREELAALGAAAVPVTADKSTAQLLTDGVRLWRHQMASVSIHK